MTPNAQKNPRLASYSDAMRRALYPPLVAMLVSAGLLGGAVAALLAASDAVEHSDKVIARTTQALGLAVDAETGQRGYLISGNPLFLEPHTRAEAELPVVLTELDKIVTDAPDQARRARAFREVFTKWQANAGEEITLRRGAAAGGAGATRQRWVTAFNSGRGKTLMDEVRRHAAELVRYEEGLKTERMRAVDATARGAVAGGTVAVFLVGLLLAFTTRRQMTALSDQYEKALDEHQAARESLTATLYGIGDAVLVTDARGLVTRMNPVAEDLTGWTEAEARGKASGVVFDIVNETTRLPVESPVDRVIREGVIVGLANHTVLRRRDGTEVAIDDSGAPVLARDGGLAGVVLIFRDVGARRAAESALEDAFRREALVNEVGAAIRNSPLDADAILRTSVAALGQGLGADRCYYGRYDQAANYARLSPEWHRDGLPPITGDYPMTRFSINRDPAYRSGGTQVVEDVRAFAPPGGTPEPSPLEALGLRALVRVPLQVGNEMTLLAVAMSDGPRRWTRSEIKVVETVASQVQSALEAARLLAEEKARAVREALLHRIGEAVMAAPDPAAVPREAASALGAALQADRCYFCTIDTDDDTIVIGEDWRANDGLPSLAGQYPLPDLGVDVERLFRGNAPLSVSDTAVGPPGGPWSAQAAAALGAMQISALVNVPFFDGDRLVAVLGVAMARTQRAWTPEEVELVEAVAAQTRSAVEAARVQQRERTVAQQLQGALTPAPPTRVPGMELAGYYRPALEEAGVGGDFLDVFSLGGGVTALVVADLAGKGLAAAAQVATVRNMLRCLLYEGLPVIEAVRRLNAILAGNRLLTGFATLFVGVYEQATGTLNYVNCGQEPGLVRRAASGEVEPLDPTGTVMGGFTEAEFDAESVTLLPGDVLALFTDGLTEAGPTHRQLLGIEGVTALVADVCARGGEAEQLSARLISGVDAFARGVTGDDICVLIGIATGPEGARGPVV